MEGGCEERVEVQGEESEADVGGAWLRSPCVGHQRRQSWRGNGKTLTGRAGSFNVMLEHEGGG